MKELSLEISKEIYEKYKFLLCELYQEVLLL